MNGSKPNRQLQKFFAQNDIQGLFEHFVKASANPYDSSAEESAELLLQLGDKGVDALISVFVNPNTPVGFKAIEILGKKRVIRAVEPLIQVLLDERRDYYTRREAAGALGEVRDTRAIEPLATVLRTRVHLPANDPRWRSDDNRNATEESFTESLRNSAAFALAAFGDMRATEQLLVVFRKYAGERKKVAQLLQRGWEPSSESQHIYYLLALEEWDELAKLGKGASQALCSVAIEDPDFKKPIIYALEKIGDTEAISRLRSKVKKVFAARVLLVGTINLVIGGAILAVFLMTSSREDLKRFLPYIILLLSVVIVSLIVGFAVRILKIKLWQLILIEALGFIFLFAGEQSSTQILFWLGILFIGLGGAGLFYMWFLGGARKQ